jgi:alpha-glucuronidase
MRKGVYLLMLAVFSLSPGLISCSLNREQRADVSNITIVSSSDATTTECLAAKEIRRYVYLRTGKLLPIVRNSKNLPSKTPVIIVGQKDCPAVRAITDKNPELASSTNSLQSQQYLIKTINFNDRQAVLITGGDSIGTLYAAYRFAEHLGARFYLQVTQSQMSVLL